MSKFITLTQVRIIPKCPIDIYDSYVHLGEIAVRKDAIVSIAKANYHDIILLTGNYDAKPIDAVFLKVTYKVNEEKFEEVYVDEQFDEVLAKLEE